MIASVSIAARESLRVSTVSLLNSQARSPAVRKVHLLLIRTRFTPREAYSCCRSRSAACTSTPCRSRAASDASSSGSDEANSIASKSRSSSALPFPALTGSSEVVTIFKFGIAAASSLSLYSLSLYPLPLFGRRRPAPISLVMTALSNLAYIERRKGCLLMNFHHTLAHELEGGGETRRKYRPS